MDNSKGISDKFALTAIMAIAEKAQSEGSFASARIARDDIVFIALQDGGKEHKKEGK
jgi:hypothetical protein